MTSVMDMGEIRIYRKSYFGSAGVTYLRIHATELGVEQRTGSLSTVLNAVSLRDRRLEEGGWVRRPVPDVREQGVRYVQENTC
jgi:hypothetical protein